LQLAIDEGRQPEVGFFSAESWNQRARVGFHAAGLAGYEEDEIQAYVQGCKLLLL
jgi:hypothetical protein